MSNRVFHFDFFGRRAIFEENLHRVRDRSLVWLMVLSAVTIIFLNNHQVSYPIHARISSDIILVILCNQVALQKTNGSHILQAMIAISRIIQISSFTDYPYRRFMGRQDNLFDLVQSINNLRMKSYRGLYCCLRVKFCRKRYFEKHILHNVAFERPLEFEDIAFKTDIIETPC